MIFKERELPLYIRKLQALARRVPIDHSQYPLIKEQLSKRLAGYRGELSIDYPLRFLPKSCLILHDLRLQDCNSYFQLDTVVLFPQFLLLIEVKNYTGMLTFDEQFHQLRQMVNAKEKTLPNPLQQIYRQKIQLQNWLRENKLPDYKIHSLVVLANQQAYIKPGPYSVEFSNTIIRVDSLLKKIDYLQKQPFPTTLTMSTIKKIAKKMEKLHQPLDTPIMEKFDVTYEHLLKGVHCPLCEHIPLKRRHGMWLCTKCSNRDKTAHISSILDYALLIDTTITNKACRDFLLVPCHSLASRLLQSMNLSFIGEKKERKYFINIP